MNLAYKILSTNLSGELVAGQQIGIQIDQNINSRFNRDNGLFTIRGNGN